MTAANATVASAPASASAAPISAPAPRRSASALTSQASMLRSSWKFDSRACSLRSMQKVIDAASQNIVAVKRGEGDGGSMLVVMERCAIVLTPVDSVHVAAAVLSNAQLREAVERDKGAVDGPEGGNMQPADGADKLHPLTFCDFAAGRRVSSFAFGTDAEGLLTCIEARMSDGGRLTLGAQGPQVQPASRRRVCAQAA